MKREEKMDIDREKLYSEYTKEQIEIRKKYIALGLNNLELDGVDDMNRYRLYAKTFNLCNSINSVREFIDEFQKSIEKRNKKGVKE